MALPTITFASTGSDTAASGSAPTTAVSGVLCATTNASTTVTITDAVALGSVPVDGSAALWVSTSTGRRWSRITAVSGSSGNWTVTVADSYGVTASGQTWGIGGKRATLANAIQLGLDIRSGWTIDVQSDQVLTANFRLAPNQVASQWTTITSTSTTRPVISTSTNSIFGLDLMGASNLIINHLSLKSTAGTPGDGIGFSTFTAGASHVIVADCVIDGFRRGITDHDNGTNVFVDALVIVGCEIKNCTTEGVGLWCGIQMEGCYLHDNVKNLQLDGQRAGDVSVSRTIFDKATNSHGVNLQLAGNAGGVFEHCVFSNSTATGVANGLNHNSSGQNPVVLRNCIFYGNKSYGIGGSGSLGSYYATNCAFGANGTAAVQSPATTGDRPITLTANPFTSATDFKLNTTTGGGALCRAAGFAIPSASATASAPDVGAIAEAISPSPAQIAAAVWDEILTGATHNINNSAGKILRSITPTLDAIYAGTCPSQAGMTTTQIKLDTGASAVSNTYNSTVISLTGGTGAGQSRVITGYTGSTKVATVETAWTTPPDATSTFEISPTASTRVSGYLAGQDPATLVLAALVGAPRSLDGLADAALTVKDALVAALSAAAGTRTISGTTWTVNTPAGTTIRTRTLDDPDHPTSAT